MTILVDSDVLLDVMTEDADWSEWSAGTLARCAEESARAMPRVTEATSRGSRSSSPGPSEPLSTEHDGRRLGSFEFRDPGARTTSTAGSMELCSW